MQSMKQDDVWNMDSLIAVPDAKSYAAVILDEGSTGREQVITEMMMRRACEMMHDEQQFPFCSVRPAAAASQRSAQPCSMNRPMSQSIGNGTRQQTNVLVLDEHRKR